MKWADPKEIVFAFACTAGGRLAASLGIGKLQIGYRTGQYRPSLTRVVTKTTGQVVAMDRSDSSDGGSTFRPVFIFTDAGAIVHTQRSSVGSSSYSFEPGEQVTILYDSAVPKHSKIDSFQTIWLLPLALTGFGLVGSAFSCWWTFLAP